MFKEKLEALKNKYMERFRLVYLLSREKTESPLHFGRIDGEKTTLLCQGMIDLKTIDACLLCGPQEMIEETKFALVQEGLSPEKIHIELFGAAPVKGKSNATSGSKRETAAAQITVKIDGHSLAFDLPFDGASILDAALQQGADLPFACKGGVCCTCKAKLVEGEVEMAVHYGLEQEEINHGFVLTCQSRPLTEKVVIDFDEK
jgi:ring-1,2-phenylacetyl-CoA epoxidase subunit PaaE